VTGENYQFSSFVLRVSGAFLVATCLCLSDFAYAGSSNTGQPAGVMAGSTAAAGEIHFYDDGKASALATHRSGLVLEFHNHFSPPPGDSILWYRLGTLDLSSKNVAWSALRLAGMTGYNSSVVISSEGYVILVYSNRAAELGSYLYYRVGKTNPQEGSDQTIRWLTNPMRLDAGFHPSIAINDHDIIVLAYNSGAGDNRIYYEIGNLVKPAGGPVEPPSGFPYQIRLTGKWIHQYDIGMDPAIGMNNRNEVIAVHQASHESALHYRRGLVSGGVIQFGESRLYDDHAESPAIAILDSGLVLEFHTLGDCLASRVDRLSLGNPQEIEWSPPVFEGEFQSPALAISGAYSIVTFDNGDFYAPKIYCTVGEVLD